jgi:hypothetical protein
MARLHHWPGPVHKKLRHPIEKSYGIREAQKSPVESRHDAGACAKCDRRRYCFSCRPSDEEIKPVLKLKHEEVGRFTEKHGVNLGWLLEGKGHIFKKDQQKLAAVVATMPMADQQAIRATIREILQERDQ